MQVCIALNFFRYFIMRMNLAFVVTSLFLAAGCSSNSADTTIKGSVKYKGKPLICGYVLMQFDDGNEAKGDIATDGTYVVSSKFVGHAKIGVGSPKPAVPEKNDRGGTTVDPSKIPDPTKWFEVPAKYQDPTTSGKETTIKSGTNTLDIDLE